LIDEAGISREDAYKIVQSNAMKIWAKEATSFLELLKAEPEIMQKLGCKFYRYNETINLLYEVLVNENQTNN
jgi:adenylosuccinate lyase